MPIQKKRRVRNGRKSVGDWGHPLEDSCQAKNRKKELGSNIMVHRISGSDLENR